MQFARIIFLIILCGTALHGMEDDPPTHPLSSSFAGWPRMFSIDYQSAARSLEPMMRGAFASGAASITTGLQEVSSSFTTGVKETMPALQHAFEQGIGGSVKVGMDYLTEAVKPDGDLQKNFRALLCQNLCMSGAIAVLTAAGTAFATYGIRTGWRAVERNLTRPKLIIASSKKTLLQRVKDRLLFRHRTPDVVPDMIFHEELETRLRDIVRATQTIHARTNAGSTNVKYRNLMLWGPPGTGKTMFAKRLAIESGLEWAIMSGSSFAKFSDGEGIRALDELFKWANKSKGLLLFIDEAEAFLAKREQMDINSKAYQLLTNFLNYTGERSNRFMIVFATNHKQVIDSAIHRRIDDLVELPLPGAAERFRVLQLYRNKILFDMEQNGKIFVDSAQLCVDDEKLTEIAKKTEGLSNGDLEGIVNIIKTDADITEYGLVTSEVVDMAVQHALEKYAAFRTRYQRRKMALYDHLWRAGE